MFRHPNFLDPNIEFVGGEVGEGGDHMNITLKNIGVTEVRNITVLLDSRFCLEVLDEAVNL